ncbi:MAG: PEP-CTERM sorting domain-containing protein [Prochlorotrichaceae cyanobacterium]|jgi:hypothetical protein
MKKLTALLTGAATLATVAFAAPAHAATFGFGNISGGDTVGDAFASEFSFDVTDYGSGKVLFKISNNGTTGTNAIKQVVFSLKDSVSSLLSSMAVDIGNVGRVDFQNRVQNLSQSNNLGSAWFGEDFGATTRGANANSIQKGESLGITFNGNYQSVLTALNYGDLKLGIHVGSLPGGCSDSYVSILPEPTKVPEPMGLLGTVALGVSAAVRRRKQAA